MIDSCRVTTHNHEAARPESRVGWNGIMVGGVGGASAASCPMRYLGFSARARPRNLVRGLESELRSRGTGVALR